MLIEKLFEFSKTYEHPRLLQHVRRSPRPSTFNFLVDRGNIQPKPSAELLILPTASWACLYHIFELVVNYTHVYEYVYFLYVSRLIKLSLYQYRVMIQFLFGIGVHTGSLANHIPSFKTIRCDCVRVDIYLRRLIEYDKRGWAVSHFNVCRNTFSEYFTLQYSTVQPIWKCTMHHACTRTGTCTVLHWLTSHNTRRCTCLHVDAWHSTLDKWSNTNY